MPLLLNDDRFGQFINRAEVKKMVQNYLNGIGGISTDRLRVIFPDQPGITEAKCCTFPLSEILALVSSNRNASAIRIYYGVHDAGNCPPDKPHYNGLHNVILVACQNVGTDDHPIYHDLLVDNVNFVTLPGFKNDDGGNSGLDMGNLCPPNNDCQGTTIP